MKEDFYKQAEDNLQRDEEKKTRAAELIIANKELTNEIILRELSLEKFEELLHFDLLT